MERLEETVYPSNAQTIIAFGAHEYDFVNCMGFENGETKYVQGEIQTIRFIKTNDDGTIVHGLQSEQLVIALMDRHKKLNQLFPSPQNEKMLAGLQLFLDACKERVDDRIGRGVMGELKK
jgi:hypothetical protein